MPPEKFVSQFNITYSTLESQAGNDILLIAELLEQLNREPIAGVKYAVYRMGGNIFIHIVQFASAEASDKFIELEAFKKFTGSMEDRLIDNVLINDIEEIGSYVTIAD